MTDMPRILRTYHGTVAARSYRATLDWLDRFVGCVALEFSNAGPPVARSGGCCWLADTQLEIAEPNSTDSPTAKFIQRFGPGYLNLALQLEDLRLADSWFTAHGAKPTLPPQTHFTFTRPSETCGLQFEWSDFKDLAWDPRQSGHPKPAAPAALIDAPRIAHWGALVTDPRAAVARFKNLWVADVLFENYSATGAEPAAALGLGDGVLTLFRLPESTQEELRLWGGSAARARFHLMAFRVRDLYATERVFLQERVRILRGSASAREIITHPEDTAGLCMAWTASDIVNDPRGPLAHSGR